MALSRVDVRAAPVSGSRAYVNPQIWRASAAVPQLGAAPAHRVASNPIHSTDGGPGRLKADEAGNRHDGEQERALIHWTLRNARCCAPAPPGRRRRRLPLRGCHIAVSTVQDWIQRAQRTPKRWCRHAGTSGGPSPGRRPRSHPPRLRHDVAALVVRNDVRQRPGSMRYAAILRNCRGVAGGDHAGWSQYRRRYALTAVPNRVTHFTPDIEWAARG
jgi:hypothetical protein